LRLLFEVSCLLRLRVVVWIPCIWHGLLLEELLLLFRVKWLDWLALVEVSGNLLDVSPEEFVVGVFGGLALPLHDGGLVNVGDGPDEPPSEDLVVLVPKLVLHFVIWVHFCQQGLYVIIQLLFALLGEFLLAYLRDYLVIRIHQLDEVVCVLEFVHHV